MPTQRIAVIVEEDGDTEAVGQVQPKEGPAIDYGAKGSAPLNAYLTSGWAVESVTGAGGGGDGDGDGCGPRFLVVLRREV